MNVSFQSPHPQVLDPNKLYAEGESMGAGSKAGRKVAGALGSMKTFWGLMLLQISWMTLASFDIGPWRHDKYPFSFLLFISNIFQLLALPVLGYISNKSEHRQAVKRAADHKALTHIAQVADSNHRIQVRIADHLGIDIDGDGVIEPNELFVGPIENPNYNGIDVPAGLLRDRKTAIIC